MSSTVEEFLIYQINNAPVREYPYPHIYVENVFPADFYAQLRANWPDPAELTSLADTGRVSKGSYRERFVLPFTPDGIDKLPDDRREFWSNFGSWFMAERFRDSIIAKFESYAQRRFDEYRKYCYFEVDSLLVCDKTQFSIGPHSDAPHRLLSLLFYCPDDASMSHLGTSIYVPCNPEFRCKGGTHHPFKNFNRVTTMAYKPNSLFAFFKTDNSFHGVEPITDENVQRDLLLYDIRVLNPHAEQGKAKNNAPVGLGWKVLRNLFGARRS
jgi:hypothetical protein